MRRILRREIEKQMREKIEKDILQKVEAENKIEFGRVSSGEIDIEDYQLG